MAEEAGGATVGQEAASMEEGEMAVSAVSCGDETMKLVSHGTTKIPASPRDSRTLDLINPISWLMRRVRASTSSG